MNKNRDVDGEQKLSQGDQDTKLIEAEDAQYHVNRWPKTHRNKLDANDAR